HAAYRFGHVMARFGYVINKKLLNNGSNFPSEKSITEVLDRSSERKIDRLPIACNWLVDWSYFFALGKELPERFNFSRPIRPYVGEHAVASDHYFPNEEKADGGIFYRDLIRGADAGVRTVDSIIANLWPKDRESG